MPSRMFFFVVIGAIIVILAVMGIIVWVQGDTETGNTGNDPHSAPIAVRG